MARTVFCRKYQQEMAGLESPPLPGARGQDIFENVSQKAWAEWQNVQTMLINEKHLSLLEPEARKYLTDQMAKFLANEPTDHAEGYTPEEDA